LLGARARPLWGVGVGVLFEIWIVDASIEFFFFVAVSCVHHQPDVRAFLAGFVLVGWWVGGVGGVCDKL
jgi:hypothetical protein